MSCTYGTLARPSEDISKQSIRLAQLINYATYLLFTTFGDEYQSIIYDEFNFLTGRKTRWISEITCERLILLCPCECTLFAGTRFSPIIVGNRRGGSVHQKRRFTAAKGGR